tara:strand:+ start:11591 stop:13645 length:2055 start_codon:yes stop_codon:yes gene_type:complete
MAGPKKVIVIDADVKLAQKNLQEVTKTVEQLEDALMEGNQQLNALKKTFNDGKASSKEIERMRKLEKTLKQVGEEMKMAKMQQKASQKAMKKSSEAATDLTGSTNMLDRATGGMVTKLKQSKAAFGGMIKQLGAVKIAVIGTGIGALVIAVISLIQAFKRSEEGQEKWQRVMAIIGAVTNQVLDGFASLGEWLIGFPKMVKDAFMSPMKTIKSFGAGVKKFLSNPFKAIKDVIVSAKDAVVDLVKETGEEMKAMDKVTKMRQKAHHLERDLMVERAISNQKVNDIRLEAEKRDIYTAAQRVVMLKKAQDLEDAITIKRMVAKQLQVDAQKLEMEQGFNDIEQKDKLAKLQGELINLDTQKLRAQRLLQTQITTAQREAITAAEQKKADDEALIEEEKAKAQGLIDFKKSIREAESDTMAEEFALELENIDEKFAILQEKALEQFELKLISEEELQEYKDQIEQARIDTANAKKLEQAKKVTDEEDKIAKKGLADKIKILQEEEKLRQDKLKRVHNFLGGLQALSEMAGKKNKALAIAMIVTEQVASVSKIISSLGVANLKAVEASPVTSGMPMVAINTIFAVANILKGLSSAKKAISSLNSNKKTVSGSAGAVASPPSRAAISTGTSDAPSVAQTNFSSIGTTGTNQIADALEGAPPIQAFVVSQDVTTAQSLDRNIVSSASIG